MRIVVQKFGGTSVADTQRIKKVAKLIANSMSEDVRVIVVVSAMAGVTNHLITLCSELSVLSTLENGAEYDTALSSGEIVTSALLALSLQANSVPARSVLAWQLPIITDANHSQALTESINTKLLEDCLKQGITPVIAGFQGMTIDNRCTTLGRGGSDTTASLIAASMNAERCDIYTDVDGIFTADPRIVLQAKKLHQITLEEMLALASSGAKVLHPRCVEIAARYNIPLRVLSSFNNTTEGTLITSRDKIMEHRLVAGITANKNLLRLKISDTSISFEKFCYILAEHNVHVEVMLNAESRNQYSFVLPLHDKHKIESLLNDLEASFTIDVNIAAIAIVGYGIKNDSNLIQEIFKILEQESVTVAAVQISEIKISILIEDDKTEKIIQLIHENLKTTNRI